MYEVSKFIFVLVFFPPRAWNYWNARQTTGRNRVWIRRGAMFSTGFLKLHIKRDVLTDVFVERHVSLDRWDNSRLVAISWLIVSRVYAKRVHRNMNRNMRAAYIDPSSFARISEFGNCLNIIGPSSNYLTLKLSEQLK